MNIDCSKYYVETRSLDDYKKVAYKNGEKLENNKELADTVVVYDFGQGEEKVTLNSKEEFSQVMKDINTRHGDGVMVSISGLGLNFLKINKGSLNSEDILPKSIEAKELTPEMRTEILEKAFREEQLFGDDEKNILNHSFVNSGFNYEKDFEKAAFGYAKYLNKDINTEYDDQVFYNLHDEELYRKEVSGKMYEYASNVLSYFMMGKETEEDKINLSNDLASAVISYAKNVANGNSDINDVDTKLKIGSIEVSYSKLHKIQSTLQSINEAGVRAVHSSEADSRLNYLGLGSNYDTVAYAQLGLRTAQVNYFADNDLPKDVASFVKNVWNERVNNTIEEKYVKPMKETNKILKEHFNLVSDYYKVGSLQSNYEGSKLQKVYDMFAKVYGNSQSEFLNSFNNAMTEYNDYRMSNAFYKDGYVGTPAEKEQLDYLTLSKDIIFN